MPTESAASAKAANDARVDLYDTGTGTPTVVFYDSGFSNVLITFNLDGTAAFGASTSACPSVATATGLPISATASAGSGTAVAGARLFDRDGTQLLEVSPTEIGSSGSGLPLQLSSTTITSGQSINLTACTISQPC